MRKWDWNSSSQRVVRSRVQLPARKWNVTCKNLFCKRKEKKLQSGPWATSKCPQRPRQLRAHPHTPSFARQPQNQTCWKWNLAKGTGREAALPTRGLLRTTGSTVWGKWRQGEAAAVAHFRNLRYQMVPLHRQPSQGWVVHLHTLSPDLKISACLQQDSRWSFNNFSAG